MIQYGRRGRLSRLAGACEAAIPSNTRISQDLHHNLMTSYRCF